METNAFSMNKIFRYFSKTEWILWVSSVFIIIFSYLLFGCDNYLNVLASLIGVTSLVIIAKEILLVRF